MTNDFFLFCASDIFLDQLSRNLSPMHLLNMPGSRVLIVYAPKSTQRRREVSGVFSLCMLHFVQNREHIMTNDLFVFCAADILLDQLSRNKSTKYWSHPEKFDPDRFAPENVQRRRAESGLRGVTPFGGGSKLCIGQGWCMFMLNVFVI